MKIRPDPDQTIGDQDADAQEPDTPGVLLRPTSDLRTTDHDIRIREQQDMLQALREQAAAGKPPLPAGTVALHVLGMAQPLLVKVDREIYLGRFDDVHKDQVKLDLTPYNAYALGVSRRHAAIRRRGDDLVLIDLESTNGTMLNGGALVPGELYRLEDGDEITLGEMVIQIYF